MEPLPNEVIEERQCKELIEAQIKAAQAQEKAWKAKEAFWKSARMSFFIEVGNVATKIKERLMGR